MKFKTKIRLTGLFSAAAERAAAAASAAALLLAICCCKVSLLFVDSSFLLYVRYVFPRSLGVSSCEPGLKTPPLINVLFVLLIGSSKAATNSFNASSVSFASILARRSSRSLRDNFVRVLIATEPCSNARNLFSPNV